MIKPILRSSLASRSLTPFWLLTLNNKTRSCQQTSALALYSITTGLATMAKIMWVIDMRIWDIFKEKKWAPHSSMFAFDIDNFLLAVTLRAKKGKLALLYKASLANVKPCISSFQSLSHSQEFTPFSLSLSLSILPLWLQNVLPLGITWSFAPRM